MLERFTWRQIRLFLAALGRRERRARALGIQDTQSAVAGCISKEGGERMNERIRKLQED